MKIILFLIFTLNIFYAAEVNSTLYEGDRTALSIYYAQMKQEIEQTIIMDEAQNERLQNEKILLSKLQELIQYQAKPFILENTFNGKKEISIEDFLKLFNNIAKISTKKETTKENQLMVQDKLAFLKNRIENILESKKENLKLYQLQFAYYKLLQRKNKALLEKASISIESGTNLLYTHLYKVKFNSNSYLLELETLDEALKEMDTKFIALNLAKEREALSSETISTQLKLKLENNIKHKNKYLKKSFDTLLLLAFYEYQEKNIDLFLEKKKLMKNTLNKLLKKDNGLYKAKYLLIKELANQQLNATDYFMLTIKETFQTLYSTLNTYLNEPLFVYDEKPILAINIFKALIIFLVGFVIAKIYHRQFIKLHNRRKDISTVLIKVIANLGFSIIFLISLFMAITSMGLSLANLAVIAGALSIGVGFALRSVVANYIAGILIMSEKNIKIGHFIRVDDLRAGKVLDIGLRATVIRTIDNTHIIIPNSDLTDKSVLNLAFEDKIRRIYVPFKIPYGSDIKMVRSLIIDAVMSSDIKLLRDVYGKKPNVWMRNLGESFIELDLFVWVEGYRPSSKSNLLILIHETLLKNNIQMPYPQLDLHLKKTKSSAILDKNILGSAIRKL